MYSCCFPCSGCCCCLVPSEDLTRLVPINGNLISQTQLVMPGIEKKQVDLAFVLSRNHSGVVTYTVNTLYNLYLSSYTSSPFICFCLNPLYPRMSHQFKGKDPLAWPGVRGARSDSAQFGLDEVWTFTHEIRCLDFGKLALLLQKVATNRNMKPKAMNIMMCNGELLGSGWNGPCKKKNIPWRQKH